MSLRSRGVRHAAAIITTGLLFLHTTIAFAAPQELSLADSIALALKNSPTVRIADASREKAAWGVKEAKAGKLPSLSLGSSYNLQQNASNLPEGDDLNNSLKLSFPLYTGGRVEGQIDQAEQGLKIADLDCEKVRQQVKLDTVTAYFNVLQAESMVVANQETVNSLQKHLDTVHAQYAAGAVAKSDVLRTEVELANAGQNLIKVQNTYDLAVASLKNVIGLEPEAEIVLTDQLAYQKYDKSLDESIEDAYRKRPEIAQAEVGIRSAEDGVKIAKSGKMPSVAFGGSTNWSNSLFPDSDSKWSLNLSATWNLFDAGATKARIQQAETGVDKAREQARQTRDGIQLEVRQAYLSMREAEKRLETTKVAIAKAEEDLYIGEEKYKMGAGTNLDVIDARLSLTQAKTNYIQALYDYNVNKAKLEKAIGAEVK